MGANGVNVNTEEVRRAAKQIRQVAATVKDLYNSDVRGMKNSLQGRAEGEMANALNEVLDELGNDILKISQSLSTIEARLESYAKAVDEADRRAAEKING